MIAEKRKPLLQLAAAVLLAVMLLTACASKATNAADKIELGQKYLTELNYTEAVAAFTEVIGLDPENIEAYMGRAEAYKGLKQYDDAKADYTTAIEKTDEMPYTQAQAYTGRAEVYVLTEESSAAESDYTSAIGLLDQDNVGEKENVAADLITQLKIKILQLHAEICMKLGWYDKAMEDYARLEELGVDMSSEQGDAESETAARSGGAYTWYYTGEDGSTTKELLTVQAGSNQLTAVGEVSHLESEDIVSMILFQEFQKKYGAIDVENMSVEQMELLSSIYESEWDSWAAMNWRPQIFETIMLSDSVSWVEKTADTLSIYVPTNTCYQDAEITFVTYDGKSKSYSIADMLDGNATTPVYLLDDSGVEGSFKLEFREAK